MPFLTSPNSMISSTTFLAILLGTANEYPMNELLPKIAVLIPIKSPLRFTSAPPEFPGLTAASV